MGKVFFDFKIDLRHVQDYNIDFKNSDIYELKAHFEGNIYILFNYLDTRDFICLEAGIFDYILQFDAVVQSIENGAQEAFSVSRDFYSNSLHYTVGSLQDDLIIYEVNNAAFKIHCKFKDFKKGYISFRKKILSEISDLFPELSYNVEFIKIFKIPI